MNHCTLRSCLAGTAIFFAALAVHAAEPATFRSAKPIWPKGRETEMNLLGGFRAVIDVPINAHKVVLRVAAASIYRAWVNGAFAGFGPACGPHGFFRVDEWDITKKLAPSKNLVAIEVAGYNCNSLYLLDQPSFCQAEVVADGCVLASTAGEGSSFLADILDYRVQKVERLGIQRTFREVYQMKPGWDGWFRDVAAAWPGVKTTVQADKRYLPRGVLYPEFALRRPVALLERGRLERREKIEIPKNDLAPIGPTMKGWPEKELPEIVSREMRHWFLKPQTDATVADVKSPLVLAAREYVDLGFGGIYAGFIGATVVCTAPTHLVMKFDDRDVICFLSYRLQPGHYRLENIEPYSVPHLTLKCLEGNCVVRDIYVREYAHPETNAASFHCSNERLNQLYRNGVLMLRQCAVDTLMDGATFDRAGYPRDGMDISRVAFDLTGNTLVEHNFFENYLLPKRFAHLPDGMLPLCYPSEHYNGMFIPNWGLWLVTQLEEYLARSGDRAMVDAFRPKVLGLLEFFKHFENSDGLLEKLSSWVLIDFSPASEFTQDVNYPSNMHYAGVLDTVARLYNMPPLAAKAERIREVIRKQSFDGQFFVDNAVRRDGKLQATRNRSETCQYFAFYFKVADRQIYAELWRKLCDEFGPHRDATKTCPEICKSSGFVGNPLRLELLSEAGCGQRVLDDILHPKVFDDFSTWAGFTSTVVHVLYRDILGLRRVDTIHKQIQIRFQDIALEKCEGTIPTPEGVVALRWVKYPDRLDYWLSHPAGYHVTIDNLSHRTLVRR